MKKMIFTGFSPNLTVHDVKLSLQYLLLPWFWNRWRRGRHIELAREKLSKLLSEPGEVTLYDSGRSALFYALKALGVGEGDEVLLQAYTCVVVCNAVRFTGARPVYVDIREDFNLDPADLVKKITSRSRALIIQHTFGQPSDLNALLKVAKETGLRTVEDCAHSLGARYQGKLTGTFGDVGMFSFGSDKVISCVRGGALYTRDAALAKKLREYEDKLPAMALHTIWQHLTHAPIFYLGKAFYRFGVGKWLLAIARALRLTNLILYPTEKRGEPSVGFPCRMPNALAHLLCEQSGRLDFVNDRRCGLAKSYRSAIVNEKVKHPPPHEGSIYLRYTVRTAQPEKMLAAAKGEMLLLGDWYRSVIAPSQSDVDSAGYTWGSCPVAERLARESVNLPTDSHIGAGDESRIIKFVNSYGQ